MHTAVSPDQVEPGAGENGDPLSRRLLGRYRSRHPARHRVPVSQLGRSAKKNMRALITFLLLIATHVCWATNVHIELPESPSANQISDFLIIRTDVGPFRSLTRQEFLRFFSDGDFGSGIDVLKDVYYSGRFVSTRGDNGPFPDSAPSNTSAYCEGAFATKAGKVFTWKMPKEGVLEIMDSQSRTGWLVIPQENEDTKPNKTLE